MIQKMATEEKINKNAIDNVIHATILWLNVLTKRVLI